MENSGATRKIVLLITYAAPTSGYRSQNFLPQKTTLNTLNTLTTLNTLNTLTGDMDFLRACRPRPRPSSMSTYIVPTRHDPMSTPTQPDPT